MKLKKTGPRRFPFGIWAQIAFPRFLAYATFFAGASLLLSGSLPMDMDRLRWLKNFVPLSVVEVSHFSGSLIGVALIFLARGLERRLDAAYFLALVLYAVGAAFSLLKGFHYEEALILTALFLMLLPARSYFYRESSFVDERYTRGWAFSIGAALFCFVWIGVFSYRHVEYSSDLWWRFAARDDASRFLRAGVGLAVSVLFFSLYKLLKPGVPRALPDAAKDFEKVASIVTASARCAANLAFLPDKRFLFSRSRDSFLMYRIQGRSWIALGDPVGPEKEWPELVLKFREMADRYDGWTVFYEIGQSHLALYLDVGLTLLKIGEDARVVLERFSPSEELDREWRHARRLGEEQYVFELLPPEEAWLRMPRLKEISDAWLASKKAREKGFSMGFFDENYLKNFPIGVVKKNDHIVAFANLWRGANREEFSVDLMRYIPEEAPKGIMDFLFIQLILWGKAQGYRHCYLGMAPLSGLKDWEFSSAWDRLGSLVFRHSEHFYHFGGIRQYKEKFHPEWEPKYLACPGGLSTAGVLKDLALLIGGTFRKKAEKEV